MGRDHCPYDSDHQHASVLCEWKAKAATNWMMETTFKHNKGVAADHTRGAFHESGQFFLDGKHGSGDDGSWWYEANKKTAPKRFALNADLWVRSIGRPLTRHTAFIFLASSSTRLFYLSPPIAERMIKPHLL